MTQESKKFYIESIRDELKRKPLEETITVSKTAMNALLHLSTKNKVTDEDTELLIRSHKKKVSDLKDQIRSAKARAAYYESKYKALKYDTEK